MKTALRLFLSILLATAAIGAHAQRAYAPGELEAMLAPIALYPDPLLSQVLDASQQPQDVATAAAWARANPQLSGDAALATVQRTAWAPSVKALAAYPEVLTRMAESPQWLHDLGEAYAANAPEVMATVQDLRARAQASGYLQSNEQQNVAQDGDAIVVQPAYPNVVYVPYYDPYVVYGAGFWTSYRPVFWSPWVVRPHFVTRVVFARPVRWYVHPHLNVVRPAPRIVHGGPTLRPYRPVPESQRAPIIHSGGSTVIHSGGTPYVHSARAPVVHGGPQPRAQFRSGYAAAGASWQHGGARSQAAAHGAHRGRR